MADPGIHPARFLQKLDLSQAEAVADLISSDNAASHQIMQQMRGGFSNEIAKLREELLNFASLSNSNSTLQKKMWNLRTEPNSTNC
jgi:tRNA modification GTPase